MIIHPTQIKLILQKLQLNLKVSPNKSDEVVISPAF